MISINPHIKNNKYNSSKITDKNWLGEIGDRDVQDV
jgi:hypothetical protein